MGPGGNLKGDEYGYLGIKFRRSRNQDKYIFFVLYGPKAVISDFQANLQSALSKNDGTFTWQKFINFEIQCGKKAFICCIYERGSIEKSIRTTFIFPRASQTSIQHSSVHSRLRV